MTTLLLHQHGRHSVSVSNHKHTQDTCACECGQHCTEVRQQETPKKTFLRHRHELACRAAAAAQALPKGCGRGGCRRPCAAPWRAAAAPTAGRAAVVVSARCRRPVAGPTACGCTVCRHRLVAGERGGWRKLSGRAHAAHMLSRAGMTTNFAEQHSSASAHRGVPPPNSSAALGSRMSGAGCWCDAAAVRAAGCCSRCCCGCWAAAGAGAVGWPASESDELP